MHDTDRGQVLIIINTLKNAGAEKQSVILANQLSEHYSVTLMVLDIRNSEVSLINKISPKVDRLFFEGFSVSNLISMINHEKIKCARIVFSMLARSNLTAAFIGFLHRDKRVYGGIRNCQIKKGKFTIEYILHKYFHTKTIFNNATGMKNLVKQGFLKDKSITIRNCVDYIPEKKGSWSTENKVVITTLSRLTPLKDLQTAISAIDYLYNHFDITSFIYNIGGHGVEKEVLRSMIKKKNLSEYIVIKESPEVHPFLREGDIYLSTSLIEGTSNSILEAMSYGMPVVATDVGDNDYLIRDSLNGYLTETGDYKTISLRLKKLIEDPGLRQRFGDESYKRVSTYFNKERFTKNYLRLINE